MKNRQKQLQQARRILLAEGEAIITLAGRIAEDSGFSQAAEMLFDCKGKVVLTGIGKAGIIARKVSGTLASTGTLSIYLHPVEALHGDLGRLERQDVVVVLSNSGASNEILRLLEHVKRRGLKLVAITGQGDSALGRHSDATVCYGPIEEACPHGLAPSVSTTCMLALGDALALTVMEMRDFKPADYAAFHPGGALGRKFLRVEEVMTFRRGERLSVACDSLTLGEALKEAEKVERRTGAMLLVDKQGKLSGILTDADLRRMLLVKSNVELFRCPVSELMTKDPKRVRLGDLASQAEAVFNQYRIDELPVVDDDDRPVGIIDVQDLLDIKTLRNE